MSSRDGRGYLLDTHTVLWALGKPDELSKAARHAVLAGLNYVSVVTYWEVTIKTMKGKLDVGDVRAWWLEALDMLSASPVTLIPEHVRGLGLLPPHHRDPFDRMLIAQAIGEKLTLISADKQVAEYASAGLNLIA